MFDTQRLCQPLFFKRNRVYRIYKGGYGYASLLGDAPEDNYFPEEWIASKVKAINPRYFGPRDGVSVVEGTELFFDDLLAEYPEQLTGGRKYDCLVKYLDSAIRLPVQVHPTKEFSAAHFNSPYGKTEAWLVIDARPGAKLYFGFSRPVDKQTLSDYEVKSLDDKDAITEILSSVEVKPGDVYLITAGLIHAIGAGCTIVEVQEPTDFTIQPENWCGEVRISEWEKYIGLTKDEALDCFDYTLTGEKALKAAKKAPKTVVERAGYRKETLITYDDTPCFAENRHTLTGGDFVMDYGPAVYIVTEGDAVIKGAGYSREIRRGDYFYLPYAAQGRFFVKGNATLIECLPSKQDTP